MVSAIPAVQSRGGPPRRGLEGIDRLVRYRWEIERTIMWLARYRRLTIRYEPRAEHFSEFLHLFAALTCFQEASHMRQPLVCINAESWASISRPSRTAQSWLSIFRNVVGRGLTGMRLVTSDAHVGLVAAIGAILPGASWQRCRTYYSANLMAVTPKASWPRVRTLKHSVYDHPDADIGQPSMVASSMRARRSCSKVAEHLDAARGDL